MSDPDLRIPTPSSRRARRAPASVARRRLGRVLATLAAAIGLYYFILWGWVGLIDETYLRDALGRWGQGLLRGADVRVHGARPSVDERSRAHVRLTSVVADHPQSEFTALADPPWDTFFELRRVDARLGLASLYGPGHAPPEIRVRGGRLNLLRNRYGQWNIDGLGAPRPADAPPFPLGHPDPDGAAFDIADVTLAFHDEASGWTATAPLRGNARWTAPRAAARPDGANPIGNGRVEGAFERTKVALQRGTRRWDDVFARLAFTQGTKKTPSSASAAAPASGPSPDATDYPRLDVELELERWPLAWGALFGPGWPDPGDEAGFTGNLSASHAPHEIHVALDGQLTGLPASLFPPHIPYRVTARARTATATETPPTDADAPRSASPAAQEATAPSLDPRLSTAETSDGRAPAAVPSPIPSDDTPRVVNAIPPGGVDFHVDIGDGGWVFVGHTAPDGRVRRLDVQARHLRWNDFPDHLKTPPAWLTWIEAQQGVITLRASTAMVRDFLFPLRDLTVTTRHGPVTPDAPPGVGNETALYGKADASFLADAEIRAEAGPWRPGQKFTPYRLEGRRLPIAPALALFRSRIPRDLRAAVRGGTAALSLAFHPTDPDPKDAPAPSPSPTRASTPAPTPATPSAPTPDASDVRPPEWEITLVAEHVTVDTLASGAVWRALADTDRGLLDADRAIARTRNTPPPAGEGNALAGLTFPTLTVTYRRTADGAEHITVRGRCLELGTVEGRVTRAREGSLIGNVIFRHVPERRWTDVPDLAQATRDAAARRGQADGAGWRFDFLHEREQPVRVTPTYVQDIYKEWLDHGRSPSK